MFEPIQIPKDKDEQKIDFKSIFEQSFVDHSEEIKHQPIAISIGSYKYKGYEYPTPFGSYGDFSCIVGASKSKKTFFKSIIEASYIGGKTNLLCPSFNGHQNSDKYIISIDTEQSKFHTQRVQRRVLEMVGDVYEKHITFSLRAFNPKERFDFINWIVYESQYKGKIGLMTIDGFADLVTDFNSLEQSSLLTEKLLEWTANGNFHCTGILHKNFGTSKPVGHVGSSILKKAETVVFIETENGITNAKCEYSRNIPFETISFQVNDNWLPFEVDNSNFENKKSNKF